jgi:hypothetical protein
MVTMAVQQPYLWAYGTAISLVVLLCAERGTPIVQGNHRNQTGILPSGSRSQTAYQTLIEMRREQRAMGTSEPDSVGPIVAKAEMRSMPAMGVDWAGYLAMQRRDTTLARPADLREVPDDAPEEPVYFAVRVGGKEVRLSLWSDAARQRLSSSGGQWRLPAGRYAVVSLELTETDSAGNRWTFKTSKAGTGRLGDFEIRPGESTSFRVGPPFQIKTSMERSGENALVGFYLEGQAGELYIPGGTRNGAIVSEPEFTIINGSEQVVGSGRFKYG